MMQSIDVMIIILSFPMHTVQILPACQEMLAAVTKFAELAYEHGRNCLSRP